MRIETYPDPPALLRGLKDLRRQGLNQRGLWFLALDPHGMIHLGLPADLGKNPLRVGEKLALRSPEERLFHFDSIHVLRDDFYLFNGDRRLAHPGDVVDVALVVANFLGWCKAPNVFFGCTPHQPGSWLLGGREVAVLHDRGVVEVLPVASGLLARRVHDHRLYYLAFADIARTGHLEGWLPVFPSPLGNILLMERRVVRERIVLSCERGLCEVNLAELPRVSETARLELPAGQLAFAVVGRVGNDAFAVTRGTPRPWGLEDLQPAMLVATPAGELTQMEAQIRAELSATSKPLH